MADQQKPNPAPAPKKSANLGQQLSQQPEETSEEPAGYNPYVAPELGPQINTNSFQSPNLGAQQRALAATQAPKQAPSVAPTEMAESEEETATAQPGTEGQQKNQLANVLEGGGLETGPSVQEQIRDELLKERAIAAAKENTGEQTEAEQEQQQAAKKLKPLPTPAQRMADRTLDAVIIGLMAFKDAVDMSLFGFDLALLGALTAPFFITIAMVLRGMQKSRTDKKLQMFFGLILFCEAIPMFAMMPSSIILFYFFRFEDTATAILEKTQGPISPGK